MKKKRGRPVILTPEEAANRRKERQDRKNANRLKAARDAKWQRGTNSGYFDRVEVLHYNRLCEILVEDGWLWEDEVAIPAHVEDAVDAVLAAYFPLPEWDSGKCSSRDRDPAFERRWPWYVPDRNETIRVKMTAELIDGLVALGVRQEYSRLNLNNTRFTGFVDVPTGFAEGLRHDHWRLRKVLEEWLFWWYSTYVPDPVSVPCNCPARLPECECRFRFRYGAHHQVSRSGVKHPRDDALPSGKPLNRSDLLRGSIGRWCRVGPRYDDDPIIRTHNKTADVGMKGFDAAAKGAWRGGSNAEYHPERDERPSTRDYNKTAAEGERELEKPYDNPRGTPKSWANRSDVAPDSDAEDGTIVPPKEEKEPED